MSLGTWIAGRYSGTLASGDLGICEDGYEISYEPKQIAIEKSDAFGLTMVDLIQAGANWSVMLESMEFKTSTIAILGQIATMGALGVIGRLASDIAGSFVLTSTAGTPAAAAPATLTASKTILHPAANPRLLFSTGLRKIPLRFAFLPFDSGAGVIKFFVQT